MKLWRVWFTHATRHEGGRATHLTDVGRASHRTLCGLSTSWGNSTEPDVRHGNAALLTDCGNCRRIGQRLLDQENERWRLAAKAARESGGIPSARARRGLRG